MCKITKLVIDSTQQGNPKALLWVDDMNINKEFDAISINFKSQILYLLFVGVGGEIKLKKNGQYTNVDVPFETGQKLESNTLVNNIFNIMFEGIARVKMGGATVISVDELKSEVLNYSKERNIIRDTILEQAVKDPINKAVLAPLLKLDDEKFKAGDKVSANTALNEQVAIYERNIIARNNYKIDIGE